MRVRRISYLLALPAALLLGGCGYVHVGRLPPPAATTVMGDSELAQENSSLRLEKKLLQQELAITRAQGEALRTVIENRNADGDTSRRLTERLNETSRELATLRAGYAQLQSDRDRAVATASEASALQSRLGAAEEKLAVSLRTYTELQDEIVRLRTEVDRTRTENVTLTEQVKVVTAQNADAQAALAQLNTQLLAQKDARIRAEQDAETLRTALQSAAPNATALAQQRTGAAAEARSLAAEQAVEIADLRKQLDEFRAKVGVLETERVQLQRQLPAADLGQIEARLATALQVNTLLRQENEQLKVSGAAPVQTLREQLLDAQAQATALTEENARLKSRLSGSRVDSARISLTSADLNRTNERPASRPAETAEDGASSPLEAPARTTSSVTASLVTTVPGSPRAGARETSGEAARVHVVAGGDTLSKISTMYYGTPTRWTEILAANRDILGESNNLIIGRTLRIP